MARLDGAELGIGKPEQTGHMSQKLLLVGMEFAVGERDVEQSFEHILQEPAVLPQEIRKLPGIGFVAGDIVLGGIEDARHASHLARGHIEHLLECLHLVACDHAVGLGHLGAERNHADGEGELMLRREQRNVVLAVEDAVIGVLAAEDGKA